MKKYLIFVFLLLFSYGAWNYAYYYDGSIYLENTEDIESFSKAEENKLWIDAGDGYEVFDLKGVNMGLGKPAGFATDGAISEEEYLRWFKEIQELGANTLRVYTKANSDFYEAFYEYNLNNPEPLYLIQGVWVDEYLLNSHRSAFDKEFYQDFLKNSKDVVDAIHGRHKSTSFFEFGSESYKKDISPWVFGYIVGVEWDGFTVAYTNNSLPQYDQYEGDYLYTEDADNFEIFLAMIGDEMISYERKKYGDQRTLAFSNWPTTDPFEYPEDLAIEFDKFSKVDVEKIKTTENFLTGQFASYHVYPYYPEYVNFMDDTVENTYQAYLEDLVNHHEMPVIISEFGVPSSRGMAAYEQNRDLGRDQGKMTEQEQGEALVSMYKEIKAAGSAGAAVFVWHDEWFKRTWNTVPYTDLDVSAYWSNYQTNEQYFGLLSFDPGEEESVVYVDGDKSEWEEDSLVISDEDYQLSMNYDEKFLYFLAEKDNFDYENEKIYLPIDLTPKSGSRYMENYQIDTSDPTDFMIEIDGKENSRVWVQERYNATPIIESKKLNRYFKKYEDPPAKSSSRFEKIDMILHEFDYYEGDEKLPFLEVDFTNNDQYTLSQTYETGKLTHGNANPKAADFNSLGDFYFGQNFVEIKIPWALVNFSDPVEMKIHDDYYENYGVEELKIDHLKIGIGNGSKEIQMSEFPLEELGRNPRYHERLKESYYILQEYWQNH